MTDPELGKGDDSAEIEKGTAVEIDPDDSKAHLINANGGAGSDHIDVKIIDGTAASSEGEVSFNGLGKDEVMRYADEPFWKRLRWILFILFWFGWFAMLVTAVVIIAVAPRCPPRPDLKWYQTETTYQVLPESFKDSNDDGIGDFTGLQDKMSYVTDELGAKAIWMSGVYKTDGLHKELGILDHKATSDDFGASAESLRAWMKKLTKEGKKVILDLVPNQSSKNHQWFKKSQKKEGKYADYYVWKKTSDKTTPPNNWKNLKGTTAWKYDDVRKEWYFSQFGDEYPDLNLANADVVDEIKDIMKFWFDLGVSGFHIKDVEYLVENSDFSEDDAAKSNTRNYRGTYEVLEELRKVADAYSDKPGRERFLFGTVYEANQNQTTELWGGKENRRLNIVMPIMKKLEKDCDAKCVHTMVDNMLSDKQYQWLGLGLGNQYQSRIASRLDKDFNKLHTAHALQLLLPGSPFNYYGDEYGQLNGNIASGSLKSDYDNFRTPMQWNGEANAGFTSANVKPWLPLGDDKNNNLKASNALFTSETPFKAFKNLIKLRKEESFQWGKVKLCAPNKDLFMFTRKATRFPYFLTMMNLGSDSTYVSLKNQKCVESKSEGIVRFHSRDVAQVGETLNFHGNSAKLEKGDVIVVEFAEDEE